MTVLSDVFFVPGSFGANYDKKKCVQWLLIKRDRRGYGGQESKICCQAGAGSMKDVIQQHTGIDLELKNWKLNDRLSALF
ncbi:hypothetical protein BpHYR1_052873 [Brachionus plicatilis]|uniref:Uncharacterized protein n=1 Tax=Brachionus plicatilis TaxID=10195 RepID=A0A3M7RJ77_BRAPC|nr:hypothetical protein BpHYR1_052873 [Brachionus plicatilis]